MTDLHSHILPGIDDGAKDVETSMELLRMQKMDNITSIVCTPHFNLERQELNEFIAKRYQAAHVLAEAVVSTGVDIQLKFGAEVRISPRMLEYDLAPLCFQNTRLLLLEMPGHRSQWDTNIIYQLTLAGVTPLIAHIERYPFIQQDPNIALEWYEAGAYLQVNAASIVDRSSRRRLVHNLIKHGLVHVVASDTHSPDKRPPLLRQAMEMIAGKFGNKTANRLNGNANLFFHGAIPVVEDPEPIRKLF